MESGIATILNPSVKAIKRSKVEPALIVQGFVAEYSHTAALLLGWHAGQPTKSFWTETKAPRAERLPLGAFRCKKCGFLEFYSGAKFAAAIKSPNLDARPNDEECGYATGPIRTLLARPSSSVFSLASVARLL
jgi:hypothetical protein